MTDITSRDSGQLVGRTAVDTTGSKIGTIADVYADDETGRPEWLAINTGLFGSKVSFAPLEGAESDGDDIVLPYDKALVKDAPKAEADGHLSPEEEQQLYTHYGRSGGGGAGWSDRDADVDVDRDRNVDVDRDRNAGVDVDRDRGRGAGYDTSGPETDDAMTRSEEEIDVNKSTRQTGTARLRKWIETEDVQMTVPVRKEKARLVTEPVTDANRGAAMTGADLTTEEHEVTLNEEVVDVDKRVVPKERVRLETEEQTEDVAVDEEIRKERIEMDQDVDVDRGRGTSRS